jgi:glutamate/aspartate transport system substrate-binding protein
MAGVALFTAVPASAQPAEGPPPRELTGVLKRIKERGAVRIGFREGAVPFAFAGRDGRAYGYSIDICQAIVDEISSSVGGVALRIDYVRVTPADRVRQVAEGRIDLECGATTGTAERRRQVAFSPLIYVAGTRLLVKRGGAIGSERDLPGRLVAVARGTTNEEAARALAARPGRAFRVEVADGFAQAFERLASGAVDAIAADDVLIAGFLATRDLRGAYAMVGAPLSHEPYGIMFARDDAPLADAVGAAFRRLAASREIRWIHDKWFLRTLPSGIRLGLPMGRELERAFELLGLPPD